MRDRVFYSICFGFAFGVLLRSLIFINIFTILLLSTISFALFIFFTLISKNKWGIVAGVFVLSFSFGVFRFSLVDKSAPAVFESQVGQAMFLKGEIIDEPDKRENNQKLVVETNVLKSETKILVTVPLDEDFKYGDVISFYGELKKPDNFITDQGKDFDYVNYLRKDGILYLMNYPEVEITARGHGNKVKSELFNIKEKFLVKINFSIPPPESLLMGGLILGERSSFSQELRQNFVDTGTIHIVALSGYNITIVAEWFMKLFAQLPYVSKNLSMGMGIFAILLFILMTGGSSTAVRAGIMAILALIARATGRGSDVGRALVLAGVFMILFNPFVLVHDVSFQLSFIATIAVIFLAPKVEKYFMWVTDRFKLRDIVSVTFAAYIFVLPFILYKMGNLSIVAFPANILILPFIPFTMALGFFTGILGLIWYVLSVPVGYLSYIFLHYELSVVNFFANVPFASFSIPDFPLFLTLLIYAYFIYRLFGKSLKNFFTTPL